MGAYVWRRRVPWQMNVRISYTQVETDKPGLSSSMTITWVGSFDGEGGRFGEVAVLTDADMIAASSAAALLFLFFLFFFLFDVGGGAGVLTTRVGCARGGSTSMISGESAYSLDTSEGGEGATTAFGRAFFLFCFFSKGSSLALFLKERALLSSSSSEGITSGTTSSSLARFFPASLPFNFIVSKPCIFVDEGIGAPTPSLYKIT